MAATLTLSLPPIELRPGVEAQLHGLACRWFEAPLATPRDVHRAQRKPWAWWPVMITPDHAELRVAWLLDDSPPAGWGPDGDSVRLGARRLPFVAETAVVDAARMRAGPPADQADCLFLSPTWFSGHGVDRPLPEARATVSSLLRSWEGCTVEPLHPDAAVIEEMLASVAVVSHHIRTLRTDAFAGIRLRGLSPLEIEHVTAHPGGLTSRAAGSRAGFVGRVRFGLVGRPSDGAQFVFATLFRWASLAGIGARTTHGYGAVAVELSRRRG